jgi:enoyl-CoA hydratase/carnithine racemase
MVVDYKKQGRIAIITMNRPEALNAISKQMQHEMNEIMTDFRDAPDLWVGIITGAGDRAFSAGADIKEFGTGPLGAMLVTIRADQIWKPFIAAINGLALGGGLEIAMECDLRIAAEHARFGQPEVNIGFMPAGGGSQRLPRFVPRALAAEMLLTGQQIDAREAYRIGLVNRVVPLDQLMPTAMELAETICQKGPLGVMATKEAMIRGHSLPLEDGLQLEKDLANRIRDTEDFTEGTKAFVEKRKPVYKAK